jgi:hypothetical protein
MTFRRPRRVRNVSVRLDALEARLAAIDRRLQSFAERWETAQTLLHTDVKQTNGDAMAVLQAIYDDEPTNRRRLEALRTRPDYNEPFDIEDPLVSVLVPTYSNASRLADRCLPSILAESHGNLEVVVVGDAALQPVVDVMKAIDDPRVRFVNLPMRGVYPEDPEARWLVAGAAPANEAMRLARGHWFCFMDDDDAFTPGRLETLLAEARAKRVELVYGRIRRVAPDEPDQMLCSFPPRPYDWGYQAALFHSGIRFFEFEIVEALFGLPADWGWIRRIMRAGVRMAMINDTVTDYYPGKLWGASDASGADVD